MTSAVITLRAPADFKKEVDDSSGSSVVIGPNAAFTILLRDDETISPKEAVDYQAHLSQKASLFQPPLERQPDTTIAGQPAYHLAGLDSIFGTWAEEFGFRYQGHTVKITFRTPRDLPQDQRDAISGPVLASVQLTG